MGSCDCLIGEWLDYDNTCLVTEQDLCENIERENRVAHILKRKKVTIADYCDCRKSVNLIRFKFCPECGRKIDWKSIRRTYDEER